MEEKKTTFKDVVKLAFRFLEGFGSSMIVANVVAATTPAAPVGLLTTACTKVATVVAGSMLGDAEAKYSDEQIDKIADSVKIELVKKDEPETIEAEVVG